jgi:hypothetical protein
MKTTVLALALATAALATPALADMVDCQIVEECYGSTPCTSSDWEFSVGTMEDGAILMSSMAGEMRYDFLAEDAGHTAWSGANMATGEVGLLTLTPDWSVVEVYTQGLYDGAERTIYAGRCAPR